MSVNGRRRVLIAGGIAAIALVVIEPAFAQSALTNARHPFAVGANEVGARGGRIGFWLIAEQAKFYRQLTHAVRATQQSAGAFWTLAGLSFAYGVFHAAGPGHGKAVMASYMVANERALARGLALTFGAALLQGLIAIGLVGVFAVVFGATAAHMTDAAQGIELVSYGAVAALGGWLVWSKGRLLAAALASVRSAPRYAMAGGAGTLSLGPPTGGTSAFVCEEISPGHVHDAACGHVHAPDPAQLGDGFSWTGALGTMAAAGARPCSGAILVLVFALAQGVFVAGVGAALFMAFGTALTTGALAATAVFAKRIALRLTGAGTARGLIVARGAEFLAAVGVLAIGLLLLFGSAYAGGMG